MRLISCLSLLSLAGGGVALHRGELGSILNYFQAGLAGLTAMSRGLLLDTINELNSTAAERAKALAESVFLETYSILVYNQSMEFVEPAKNTHDAQHLFIALQNWEQQTSAFLDELSQRADTFVADPDLIHDLAGNLTLLRHAATDFARNFRDLIPSWAEEISKTIADLLNSFHGTLTVFSQIT